jgi:hypothetical protein
MMRTSGARWAWLLAVTFLVATVVVVLVSLNITAPAPDFADDANLPDIIFANFASARAAWVQDMGSSVLYALGFLAIAALGPILRATLDRSDPRATRVAVLFLVAGTIGILSQIIYVGGKEVATAPYYCDCDYLAAQLISRGSVLDVIVGIQGWMVDAFSFLFALGLLAAASLANARAWPVGFVRASQGLAVLGLGSVVWDRVAVTLLVNAQVDIDYGKIGLVILAIIAGLATPIWAVWLARTLPRTEGAS